MEGQSELVKEIATAIQIPYWVDMGAGVFELGAYVVVMVIAHILAKKREAGGVSMLICVYLSLLLAMLPFLFPTNSFFLGSPSSILVFASQVLSAFLMFMATIHLLRFIYAKTS